MTHDIIPPHLAIKSMRDSGYKDAAHAVAELVDNSIQAEAHNIEIVCIDKLEMRRSRHRRRISHIVVFDDGKGMDARVLRMALQFGNGTHLAPEEQEGIGKFGMGLPNASFSQCRRVDVWSWQNSECYYTYLDLDEILNGKVREVPEPTRTQLPEEWLDCVDAEATDAGTLVLWRELDRVRWKSSKAFLTNSEFLVGRIYRYFITGNKAKIRLAAYEDSAGDVKLAWQDYVRPNDPMYLMGHTSTPKLPSPHEDRHMFDEYGEDHLDVTIDDDSTHRVTLKFSIVNNDIRKALANSGGNPGHTPAGQHAGKNIGVSVVRAGRELEINRTFDVGYDPTERWWGVEVSFSPALDEIFGVTNNKQAATNFYKMILEEDAAAEEMTPQEYKDSLKEENDPRVIIYELSQKIDANLRSMRKQLKRVREGTRAPTRETEVDPAEEAATAATKQRQREGYRGDSDRDEEMSEEQRQEALAQMLEESGMTADEAREIAVRHVQSGLKYIFERTHYDGPSFFTCSRKGGSIIVNINGEHPVTRYLYELLEENEDAHRDTLLALKLILAAWARMEDEAQTGELRTKLSDMRNDWGRLTRDFILAARERLDNSPR